MKIIYCGLFVDAEELYEMFPPKLARRIEFPHVTTKFRPGGPDLHEDWLGREFELVVDGYGIDQDNEGLRVAEIDAFKTITKPHITLSVSENGKPVETVNLDFKDCARRTIMARFGWYCADGTVYYGAH